MSTLERTCQRGRSEGKAEGRADALLRLLQSRLAVDDATRERVRAAAVEQLDRWLDRVLDAGTLADVFGDA